jgi:hypothetical protein
VTYREQDPAALRERIAGLETEIARLRAKPAKRRLTKRGWLLLWHFVCLAAACGAAVPAFATHEPAWLALIVPAGVWAVLALVWQGELASYREVPFTEESQ